MMKLNLKKHWRQYRLLILGLLAVYLFFCAALLWLAPRFIFQPPPKAAQPPANSFYIPTAAGRINTIYVTPPHPIATILYSHGNAADLTHLLPLIHSLKQQGYAVLAYDYNGYGYSAGTASEKNCYLDAMASYQYLRHKLNTPPQKIILLAHSLGTGVAVDLATHVRFAGLILKSPLLSAYRVVTFHSWPLFPFDRFNNASKIQQVHRPLLIIHGTADKVIPVYHGLRLYQLANQPKQLILVKGAGHNNLGGNQLAKKIKQFIGSALSTPIEKSITSNPTAHNKAATSDASGPHF